MQTQTGDSSYPPHDWSVKRIARNIIYRTEVSNLCGSEYTIADHGSNNNGENMTSSDVSSLSVRVVDERVREALQIGALNVRRPKGSGVVPNKHVDAFCYIC